MYSSSILEKFILNIHNETCRYRDVSREEVTEMMKVRAFIYNRSYIS